ncbi:V-type proton ATPase subunit C-like protein [Tanacetum coccineum]
MVPLGYKPFGSHIKVRIAEYNNVCSQLVAINRKQTGSLAVCDLSNIVTPNDIVSSEYLSTLIAVVPKSSKNLHEDNEYALYTVTLLKRDADNFRTKARNRGFQICDIEYNSETQESQKQELENLMQDQESLRSSLLQWCYTSYGESVIIMRINGVLVIIIINEARFGKPIMKEALVVKPTLTRTSPLPLILCEHYVAVSGVGVDFYHLD